MHVFLCFFYQIQQLNTDQQYLQFGVKGLPGSQQKFKYDCCGGD